MKILVTAKRVEDPESKIKVQPEGTGIVTDGLKEGDRVVVSNVQKLMDGAPVAVQ